MVLTNLGKANTDLFGELKKIFKTPPPPILGDSIIAWLYSENSFTKISFA